MRSLVGPLGPEIGTFPLLALVNSCHFSQQHHLLVFSYHTHKMGSISSSERATVADLAMQFHLDVEYLKSLLSGLHKRYPSGFLTKRDLKKSLNVHLCSDEMTSQLMKLFDQNGDKRISIPEYLEGMVRMRYGTAKERFEYAFHVFDADGDGKLSPEEITTIVLSLLLEKRDGSHLTKSEVVSLTRQLLKQLDSDGDGHVDLDEFQELVNKDFNMTEKIMDLASFVSFEETE
mmetsp:Transcript_11112/g.41507  ORF Transcript_11112/g.41507 Transcript_11112/m.41507 type:complete len:232 (-) Transcript_11112:2398-3093(-)